MLAALRGAAAAVAGPLSFGVFVLVGALAIGAFTVPELRPLPDGDAGTPGAPKSHFLTLSVSAGRAANGRHDGHHQRGGGSGTSGPGR